MSKTVLVVDDSRIMRNIVKNSFLSMRVECTFLEAADGLAAFKILEENDIDLVFLDWNMPHLSGIEFLQKVRAMPKYEELPIVMVTSEAARFNVIEALKSGVTAYLVKPVSEDKFVKTLKTITY